MPPQICPLLLTIDSWGSNFYTIRSKYVNFLRKLMPTKDKNPKMTIMFEGMKIYWKLYSFVLNGTHQILEVSGYCFLNWFESCHWLTQSVQSEGMSQPSGPWLDQTSSRDVLFEFHLGIPVISLLWGRQTSKWYNCSTKRNNCSTVFK